MRKIVLLFLLMVVAMISTVFADSGLANYGNRSKVMPIIWVSPEDVSDVTETEQILYTGVQKVVASNADVIPLDEAQATFREYLMENDRTPDSIKDVNGYLPKKKEIQEMAQLNNADYVIVISTRATDKKEKTAWLAFSPVKYEVTVAFTTLVYSVKEGTYIYNKQVSVKDNAAGTSSYERAFKKACNKYVKQLDLPALVPVTTTASTVQAVQ